MKNYGYHWWITDHGHLALAKHGQYLYLIARDVFIVRLGEAQGDVSWVEVMDQVAGSLAEAAGT